MLKLRRGRAGLKEHPLASRPLPLSAFAGRWPLRVALEPSRVAVFGDAVRPRAAPPGAQPKRRRCLLGLLRCG